MSCCAPTREIVSTRRVLFRSRALAPFPVIIFAGGRPEDARRIICLPKGRTERGGELNGAEFLPILRSAVPCIRVTRRDSFQFLSPAELFRGPS